MKRGNPKKKGASSTEDVSGEFHRHYAKAYKERYAALFAALAAPTQHCALANTFCEAHGCEEEGMERFFAAQASVAYR